jgi:tetratricopeptide (TPR) repeat protein
MIPMFAVAVTLTTFMFLAGSPAAAANGYGHVEFANSGAPSAQADFQDGVALLHDFEYESAAAAFRRAEASDPGFAMAYWGEAMTFNHPIWMERDLEAARAALNKLAPTPAERRARAKTDRENAYLDAIEILYGEGTKESRDFRYETAMAKLHDQYPDDVDGAAFYALSILGTAHGGRDVATYMRAAGVLEEAWINHHDHPGLVHYLIHTYDDPAHAPLGLRAARIYARLAPDAGHAQHMTSHIFLALGMWPATVDANLAAIAAKDRTRRAAGEEPVVCGHYLSFLAYAYLQLGQMDKARSAVTACGATMKAKAVAEQPSQSMDPDNSIAGSFANMRLRYLLDTGDWSGELAGWPLPMTSGPGARLDFAFARAMGEIEQGLVAAAHEALGTLDAVARDVIDIETKAGGADPSYRVRAEIFVLEARGLLAEQEKNSAGAEKLLRQAVASEETLPIAFGPPIIDKPTHELLGEFLLRHARADEAQVEFGKALARTPGRRLAERGLAAASPGAAQGGT